MAEAKRDAAARGESVRRGRRGLWVAVWALAAALAVALVACPSSRTSYWDQDPSSTKRNGSTTRASKTTSSTTTSRPPKGDRTPPPVKPGKVVDGIFSDLDPSRPALELVMVDVGQGDGMFIVSPQRKTIVIDTGTSKGGKAMVEAMRDEGLDTVDLMVLTHPHADHIGGADEIIKAMEVERVLDPGFPYSSRSYERLLELIRERDITFVTARRPRKINLGDGITLTILAPDAKPLEGTRSDANSNSVVLRLTYGDVSVLFTGDAEIETEELLTSFDGKPEPLESTVLKVAHHGSAHASKHAFLKRVKPKLALISAGRNNKYGHPAVETLKRIRDYTNRIFLTAKHGTIHLRTDGRRIKVWTDSGDALP